MVPTKDIQAVAALQSGVSRSHGGQAARRICNAGNALPLSNFEYLLQLHCSICARFDSVRLISESVHSAGKEPKTLLVLSISLLAHITYYLNSYKYVQIFCVDIYEYGSPKFRVSRQHRLHLRKERRRKGLCRAPPPLHIERVQLQHAFVPPPSARDDEDVPELVRMKPVVVFAGA